MITTPKKPWITPTLKPVAVTRELLARFAANPEKQSPKPEKTG